MEAGEASWAGVVDRSLFKWLYVFKTSILKMDTARPALLPGADMWRCGHCKELKYYTGSR